MLQHPLQAQRPSWGHEARGGQLQQAGEVASTQLLPAAGRKRWCERRNCRVAAVKPDASFENDDLDTDLAAELRAVADPKRTERMRSHYELLWKATRARGQVQTCTCCSGSGEKECDWCHGTGFMTVGDRVFTGLAKNECPVCKAKGYVKCEFCRGTGSRAQWMPSMFDSPKQQQEQGGGPSSS